MPGVMFAAVRAACAGLSPRSGSAVAIDSGVIIAITCSPTSGCCHIWATSCHT